MTSHESGHEKTQSQKSFKARTTGKLNRSVKSAINPLYGKKGMGILHPKKAIYNNVYNKTTVSLFDLFKKLFK